MYTFKLISVNKLTTMALGLFTIGVLLNEIVLAIQGVAAFGYIVVKYVNGILFSISLLLLLGAVLMLLSQRNKAVEA